MAEKIYKVRYVNEGRVFELYARNVCSSAMFGFIEVEKLVWGKKSEVIVDPSEQELKNEFAGVKRTFIPLHAIVRIDEVEKSGAAKILPLAGNAQRDPSDILLHARHARTPKKD